MSFFKSSAKKEKLKPVDNASLFIREMRHNDIYDLFKIVGDFRKNFYINVYKSIFRSWFTYVTTGILLGLSLSLINSTMASVCFPPLVITVFLLWKVNRYKRINYLPSVQDMEQLNETATFKSVESRRINQGVLLIFVKEQMKLTDDILLDSDLEEEDDDVNEDDITETKTTNKKSSKNPNRKLFDNKDRNQKLIGYLIYGKQKDELETLCIREICIHGDYRERHVASNFIKRACQNIFQLYGYKRVAFQVSIFNFEAARICLKKSSNVIIKKLYSWAAYQFVPGVQDERTVYSFDINNLK